MKSIYVPSEPEFTAILSKLGQSLESRGWSLTTAESCTGGWIAKCCTDLAGSSSWFDRGFVTYSNAAKHRMLGVAEETLLNDGAVSKAVALQMAYGARIKAGVDVAVAVTGVAGPGGGSAEKPVGTVWFGWSLNQQCELAEMREFAGDRDAIRRQTVGYALGRLLELLDE
jgi:nicotinamide-nucleotide amidase